MQGQSRIRGTAPLTRSGRRRLALSATAIAAGALLAACAGGGSYGSGASDQPRTTSSNAALDTTRIAGIGAVLTDSTGNTLYTADQESRGTIRCTADCLTVWLPVTAAGDVHAPAPLMQQVATVARPDNGERQVTFDGAPLYTFALGDSPGSASGDGVQDSFGGTTFTWHAARVSGSSGASSPASPPGGGYSSNGYGY